MLVYSFFVCESLHYSSLLRVLGFQHLTSPKDSAMFVGGMSGSAPGGQRAARGGARRAVRDRETGNGAVTSCLS